MGEPRSETGNGVPKDPDHVTTGFDTTTPLISQSLQCLRRFRPSSFGHRPAARLVEGHDHFEPASPPPEAPESQLCLPPAGAHHMSRPVLVPPWTRHVGQRTRDHRYRDASRSGLLSGRLWSHSLACRRPRTQLRPVHSPPWHAIPGYPPRLWRDARVPPGTWSGGTRPVPGRGQSPINRSRRRADARPGPYRS
jgi:hypothetical protein